MKKKVMKSVDLVLILQQETEVGNAPKLITGQLRVPVDDELPCNRLAVFTETKGRKKHKPYEHIAETEHWSLTQRKDMKFYVAQRKGFDGERIKADPAAWKLEMMKQFNEVLDAVITAVNS